MAVDTAVAPALDTELTQADTGITPETEAEGTSDTEGQEGEAETEQEEQLTRSEADKLAQEQLEAYKKEQEVLQRDDAGRRAFESIVQRGVAARDGGLQKQLQGIVTWAANEAREGREPEKGVDPNVIYKMRDDLSSWVTVAELQAIDQLMNTWLAKEFPDYKPSRALVEKAQRAWLRDSETERVFLAHPEQAWQARLQIHEEAIRLDERAKVLAEQDEEQREKDKATKQRQAEGKATTGPTRVGGNGVQSRTPRQILDDPTSSVEARKKALFEDTGFQM